MTQIPKIYMRGVTKHVTKPPDQKLFIMINLSNYNRMKVSCYFCCQASQATGKKDHELQRNKSKQPKMELREGIHSQKGTSGFLEVERQSEVLSFFSLLLLPQSDAKVNLFCDPRAMTQTLMRNTTVKLF